MQPVERQRGAHDATGLLSVDASRFAADFDRRGFLIAHALDISSLFSLERLSVLSRELPPQCVEYNAGELPVSVDPRAVKRTGLSAQETIEGIAHARSWVALKNVERHPAYAALVNRCLDELQTHVERVDPGMCLREAFIFISSPHAVTPYHIDPEFNFLLQLQGSKRITQFDAWDRAVISEAELERKALGAHRNLVFHEHYRPKGREFVLMPGMGLHFPLFAPHWVQNGDEPSISLSITFQTRSSRRRLAAHRLNGRLRRWGWRPAPVSRASARDALKFQVLRVLERIERLGRPPAKPAPRY